MSDRNAAAKGGSSSSSCSVVPTSRSVIEGKLLDALSNDGCVAILASEDDLNVMIAALEYAMLGNHKQTVAARDLAKDMRQLRKEAFPPNHEQHEQHNQSRPDTHSTQRMRLRMRIFRRNH